MNPLSEIGRLLLVLGLAMALVGAALLFWDRLPWLQRLAQWLPLGRLPGDIRVEGGHYRFFFPLVTGLVLSVVLTVLLNLFRK